MKEETNVSTRGNERSFSVSLNTLVWWTFGESDIEETKVFSSQDIRSFTGKERQRDRERETERERERQRQTDRDRETKG
jgi:hypothetical protein